MLFGTGGRDNCARAYVAEHERCFGCRVTGVQRRRSTIRKNGQENGGSLGTISKRECDCVLGGDAVCLEVRMRALDLTTQFGIAETISFYVRYCYSR